MKKMIFILVFSLLKISFAQIDVAQPEMLNENFNIIELIRKLSLAIKHQDEELLNKLIHPSNNEQSVNYSKSKSEFETELNKNNYDNIRISLNDLPNLASVPSTASASVSFYLFSSEDVKNFNLELEFVKENDS